MVRGISTKRVKKEAPVDPVAREERIMKKVSRLANAIRIPGPINQFKAALTGNEQERLLNFFAKYMPESKEEKAERLASADPKSGPKPIIVKFGLKHIVSLIEQKRPKLVLIAADVTPITVVVAIPSLCKKMGVPYAIVETRESLGKLVRMKSTAAVALEDCRPEDKAEFNDLVVMANAMFADQYEKHMKTTGGMVSRHAAVNAE